VTGRRRVRAAGSPATSGLRAAGSRAGSSAGPSLGSSWAAGPRARVVAVLVAALLFAGAGAAVAGWRTAGPGSATARAGAITAPTGLTAGTRTCAGLLQATQPYTWTEVRGAVSYGWQSASNAAFTTGVQTGTSTSATASTTALGLSARTEYFRVRAVAGNWTSDYGPALTTTVRSCLQQ
jgi:hypothetical protein